MGIVTEYKSHYFCFHFVIKVWINSNVGFHLRTKNNEQKIYESNHTVLFLQFAIGKFLKKNFYVIRSPGTFNFACVHLKSHSFLPFYSFGCIDKIYNWKKKLWSNNNCE